MSALDAIAASDLSSTLRTTGVEMSHTRAGNTTELVGTVAQKSLAGAPVGLGGMGRSLTGAANEMYVVEVPANVPGQSAEKTLNDVRTGDTFTVPGVCVNMPATPTVTLLARGVPELVGGRWIVECGR